MIDHQLRKPGGEPYLPEHTRTTLVDALWHVFPRRSVERFVDYVMDASPEVEALERADSVWRHNAAVVDRLRAVDAPRRYGSLRHELHAVADALVLGPSKHPSVFAEGRRAGLKSARNEVLDYARDEGRTARSLIDPIHPRVDRTGQLSGRPLTIHVVRLRTQMQRVAHLNRLFREYFGECPEQAAVVRALDTGLPPLDVVDASQQQAEAHQLAAEELRRDLLDQWNLLSFARKERLEIRQRLLELAAQVAPSGAINGDTGFATGFHVGCLTASKLLLARAEEMYPSVLLR